MQKQTFDNGRFIAELSDKGTLWLTDDEHKHEIELPPAAAYGLLEMLYQNRTLLHRVSQGLPPEEELPDWVMGNARMWPTQEEMQQE